MKKRYLLFEALFALQLILRCLFPHILTWKLSILSILAIFSLKFTYEGFRLHWFLFVFSGLLSIPNYSILHFLAAALVLFSIIYFPIFDNLDLTGPFQVGYKEIWLSNDTLHVSVYYPTTEKGPDSAQFAGKVPPWKNFVEMVKLSQNGKASEWFYRVALSYLEHRKLGVNTNVPIIKESKPFPVIVFSHGLGSSRNSYSFFLKEWASRGYIVLTPDHKDITYPPSGVVTDFEHRTADLNKRLEDGKEILDFVGNPNGLKKLFGGNIEIDKNRISAAGHSYGGCTATYLSIVDPRVTGACVCMDPWYFPLKEESYKSMNKPMLVIITTIFESFSPGNKAKTLKLAKLNKGFEDQSMVCYFEGNEHNNFADSGLFMGREMSMMKILSPVGLIEKMFRNNASLIEAFLEATVLERKNGGKVTREDILKRYGQKKHHPEIKLIQEDFIEN